MRGRIADPRHVLELIDDISALGPIPDASVRRDPREIKHEHAHRQGGKQDEDREVEPVDPPQAALGRKRDRAALEPRGRRWRNPWRGERYDASLLPSALLMRAPF